MTLDRIREEYDHNGRISRRSVAELKELLAGPEPYSAITLATDLACFELVPDIARSLTSADPMVRWNAAGALFTRFREKRYLRECLNIAKEDPDSMVREIAVVGVGELLVLADPGELRKACARFLFDTFSDESEDPLRRAAAYEGMLAAMDVLPLDRPTVTEMPDLSNVDRRIIDAFRERYVDAG